MPESMNLNISGTVFEIELVATGEQKWRGLSDRTTLATRAGMLFIWDEEEPRRFNMRRMHFSIDILFIDRSGFLINKCCDAAPWRGPVGRHYYSNRPAMYVLEVNAGTCGSLGIEEGDRVFQTERLAACESS